MLREIGFQHQGVQCATRFTVAFEWPRDNDGWKLPAMQKMRKLMPHAADFDGCRYGLAGKKPWWVITNSKALLPGLSSKCNHTAPHGALRGERLKKTEKYSASIARSVSRGLAKSTQTMGVLKANASRVMATDRPELNHYLTFLK